MSRNDDDAAEIPLGPSMTMPAPPGPAAVIEASTFWAMMLTVLVNGPKLPEDRTLIVHRHWFS